MHEHRADGVAKHAKGAIKEAFGKVTGDMKVEAEGKAEQVAGKVEKEIGTMQNSVRAVAKG